MITSEALIETIKGLGLSAVLILAILGICIWLIRFIALRLAKEIDKTTETLEGLCRRMESHENTASRNREYVRKEHEQMIQVLYKINGKG